MDYPFKAVRFPTDVTRCPSSSSSRASLLSSLKHWCDIMLSVNGLKLRPTPY